MVLGAPATDGAGIRPQRPTGGIDTRRRLAIIVGAIAVAVVAVVVAVVVWAGAASTPPPQPELPQLEEPLGTHLQELMDEVTP